MKGDEQYNDLIISESESDGECNVCGEECKIKVVIYRDCESCKALKMLKNLEDNRINYENALSTIECNKESLINHIENVLGYKIPNDIFDELEGDENGK